MQFMVIERFAGNDMLPVYRALRDGGRRLPPGLSFVGAWVEVGFGRCFQLMESDSLAAIQDWVLEWRGHGVTFEVIPVLSSAETQALVAPHLERGA